MEKKKSLKIGYDFLIYISVKRRMNANVSIALCIFINVTIASTKIN